MFENLGLSDVKLIGRGGSASVYSAVDPKLGPVAVKVLRATGLNPASRFRREVEALSALDGLNGVVRVLGTGQTSDGDPFIIMPLMNQSLQTIVGTWGPLRWVEAAGIVADVAEVVHQAHLRGVVHADIKPENLLLDEANNVYVSDFGIARVLQASTPTVTTPGWTPTYAAPEVEEGQRATPLADVYSLGATLAALITGNTGPSSSRPRHASIEAMMNDLATVIPGQSVPDADALTDVVATAMASDPADRYQSAQEVADAIRRSLSSEAERNATVIRYDRPDASPLAAVAVVDEPPRKRRWPLALLGLLLLAGAGAAGYFFYYETTDTDTDPTSIASATTSTTPTTVTAPVDDTEPADGDDVDDTEPADEVTPRPGCAITVQPGDEVLAAVGELVAGESLCLAPGTHLVSAPVQPGDGVRLVGTDAETTVLLGDDNMSASAVISIGGGSVTIERLTVAFEGERPEVDVMAVGDAELAMDEVIVRGGTRHGLSIFGATTATVRRSQFVDNGGNGMVASGESMVEVGDATATGNGRAGFLWTDSAGGAALGSSASANAEAGFEVSGTATPDLIGNTSDTNASGFFWSDSGAGSASSNSASENEFDGFGTGDQSAPRLVGNTAANNTNAGFAFGAASGPEAVDNTADGNQNGFLVWGTAAPDLELNMASDNSLNGFVWFDDSAGQATGNQAVGNGANGFSFSGASTPTVSGSVATDNGSPVTVETGANPTLEDDNEF